MAIADVSGKSVADLISLAGRRAVVTGAAQGLGKAIAARLAEAGADLLIGDLNADLATQAAVELQSAHGVRAVATRMDVTDAASVSAAASLAIDELGGFEIWVNNAGIYPNVGLLEMTEAVWNKVMDVNLRGVFLGAQEAARHMIPSGGDGRVIVNIVSTAGSRGLAPGISAYVASKFGVNGLTRQLSVELAPAGIRVMGVAPTFCETEGNRAAIAAMPKEQADALDCVMSPLGRVGVADDIGRVVLFCASDLSVYMTGSTLMVDAGEMA